MLRRKLLIFLMLMLVAAIAGGATVYWAVTRVPEFYGEALAQQPEDPVVQAAARQLEEQTTRLAEEIQYSDEWSAEFEQTRINSWLAENLDEASNTARLPPGVSSPRVLFRSGTVHVGFRLIRTGFDGVVSVAVRPMLAGPNLLELEVIDVRTGLISVPMERITRQVTQLLQKHGQNSTWLNRNGHDVLQIELNPGVEGTPVLEEIELRDGTIRLQGRGGSHKNIQSWRSALSSLPGTGEAIIR